MKLFLQVSLVVTLLLFSGLQANGQFQEKGFGGGIGFGATLGQTDLEDGGLGIFTRGFLRYGIIPHLQGEIGVGLGRVSGSEYQSLVVPADYRLLLSPLSSESWNPYLYAGAGILHYNYEEIPKNATPGLERNGWTGFVPAGIGMEFMIDDIVAFEMSGGYNYTFKDNLNAFEGDDKKDAYFNVLAGLTVTGESGSSDPDGDGLTNKEEKELGTDPRVADSDGDRLNDGTEVRTYKTSPLNADSDGDGIGDGDEVTKYKTDPNKADTDADGLKDGDEIMKHKTDPIKADTDGDGLNDGDEVMNYKTDPLKADTDGDGVKDGDEVNRYKTDPLRMDTDAGTANDGMEINRGTDPLNAADDIPKKEEITVEVGKSIVLEGVVFSTGKAVITPESEDILTMVFNTLDQNPDIEVEIQGHTDNVGKKSSNQRLSLARAEAVKAWLVNKGIAEKRITTKGFGPDRPIALNTTAEGRQKNRRIEFFRTK